MFANGSALLLTDMLPLGNVIHSSLWGEGGSAYS